MLPDCPPVLHPSFMWCTGLYQAIVGSHRTKAKPTYIIESSRVMQIRSFFASSSAVSTWNCMHRLRNNARIHLCLAHRRRRHSASIQCPYVASWLTHEGLSVSIIRALCTSYSFNQTCIARQSNSHTVSHDPLRLGMLPPSIRCIAFTSGRSAVENRCLFVVFAGSPQDSSRFSFPLPIMCN